MAPKREAVDDESTASSKKTRTSPPPTSPKRKADADDSSVPSKKPKCSTGPTSDRTNWEEVEFVIKTHVNNLPDPYGTTSTATGPMKWADVAALFNQRFGKKPIGPAACEKRYRQKLEEYRQRDPAYPDPKTIVYAPKPQPAKKGAQKGVQKGHQKGIQKDAQKGVQKGSRSAQPPPPSQTSGPTKPSVDQAARETINKRDDAPARQDPEFDQSDSEDSIEDSADNRSNGGGSIGDSESGTEGEDNQLHDDNGVPPAEATEESTSVDAPHQQEMAPGNSRKRFIDEQLKKSAAVCEQILPKELREIAAPEFYFEYGGSVKKHEFKKWTTLEVTTSDGLKCGSVDLLTKDIRANSDVIDEALLYERRTGVALEVQGYSKSIVEIFAQCCHTAFDKDDLPECLPACTAHKARLEKKDDAPVCIRRCLRNQQRHAHIPADTSREDLPQYLRCRNGPYLPPEFHYTLVRQRQTDGTLRLLPVVRRIEWCMSELVELYLLATELQVEYIRHMVMHRWLETMEGAAPPLDFAPETLNRLLSHPEVGRHLKKFFSQWVHQDGLADYILDTAEEWEKGFVEILYGLEHGLESPLLIVPLGNSKDQSEKMRKKHEPGLKAITARLLHAAQRDYNGAYDQLKTRLGTGKKTASSTPMNDTNAVEQLFEEFRQKKLILEASKGISTFGLQGGNNLSDTDPDEPQQKCSEDDSSGDDVTEDEEEW